jgi:hypothetical protein
VLRLTASDGALVGSADVTITVAPANQAPVVSAGPNQTIMLPAFADLNGSATDDGFPSGILTISWSKLSGPGVVTFLNASAVHTTASFSTSGTYVLRLTASDSALSSSANVTITVAPANQAPVVSAGANQTITWPATAVLGGLVTDDGLPFGIPLTITWSTVSGPGSVTFKNLDVPATTAAFSVPGPYVLRLTATDSALVAFADVTITVSSPSLPPCGPVVSGSVTLIAAATDDDGVAGARFLLDGVAIGRQFNNPPFSLTWNTTNAPNGCHTLSAIAWDPDENVGESDPLFVVINNP